MTNYVFAYSGGTGMPETPEAQEQVMAEWGAWFGTLGAALVDSGAPSGPPPGAAGRRRPDRSSPRAARGSPGPGIEPDSARPNGPFAQLPPPGSEWPRDNPRLGRRVHPATRRDSGM
jgi:hypothetical protein